MSIGTVISSDNENKHQKKREKILCSQKKDVPLQSKSKKASLERWVSG